MDVKIKSGRHERCKRTGGTSWSSPITPNVYNDHKHSFRCKMNTLKTSNPSFAPPTPRNNHDIVWFSVSLCGTQACTNSPVSCENCCKVQVLKQQINSSFVFSSFHCPHKHTRTRTHLAIILPLSLRQPEG